MTINEASKMATRDLAQTEISAISSYFECNKRSALHAGVLSFPEVHWCITCGINNCHDAYVAFYRVYFSHEIG